MHFGMLHRMPVIVFTLSQAKESDFERLQTDWQQKLKQAEEKMRQENSFLEHTGNIFTWRVVLWQSK